MQTYMFQRALEFTETRSWVWQVHVLLHVFGHCSMYDSYREKKKRWWRQAQPEEKGGGRLNL